MNVLTSESTKRAVKATVDTASFGRRVVTNQVSWSSHADSDVLAWYSGDEGLSWEEGTHINIVTNIQTINMGLI